MLPTLSVAEPPARARRLGIVAAGLAALLVSVDWAAAQRFDVQRVTVSTSGNEANAYSPAGALSGSGRFVVFRSDATNLVPNDTNGVMDVFVHDRVTRSTTRVSVATGGAQANGASRVVDPNQLISRDGRYVVFESDATNLVPGDTNGVTDIFVHDRQTGQTQRVNLGPGGVQANAESVWPHLSADGRFVTFTSGASLAPGAPHGLYIRDLVAGQTTLVSRSTGGTPGNDGSYSGYMSADGRHVAFQSFASNLVPGDTNVNWDIFVHDRQTGSTTRVNVSADVAQAGGQSGHPRISGNGRFVTFATDPFAALILDDTNGAEDVYMHDRDTDRDGIFDEPGAVRTFLISKSAAGVQANAFSLGQAMNYDGRYVTVTSDASNLLGPGQDQNGARDIFLYELDVDDDGVFDEPGDQRITRLSVALDGSPLGGGQGYTHDISEDGRYVHFDSNASDIVRDDENGVMDSYVVDRLAWRTTTTVAPTTPLQQPRLSGDGGWSVFASADAALVSGDTNGHVDVFVRNRRLPLGQPGAVVRVSIATDGGQAIGGPSDQAAISGDGRFVVFRSAAVNLVPLDTNGAADIFLHDRDTDLDGILDEPGARRTVRVSIATGGLQAAGGASETPHISPDGRYIVFVSAATNLGGTANGLRQVFLHERLSGATIRLSERNGQPANASAVTPVVGNNGTAAFVSAATNLSDADGNGVGDVYASVVPSGGGRAVLLVSHRLGAAVPGESGAPAISADGLVVAFQSSASTLVSGDVNAASDVFAAGIGRVPQHGVGPVRRVSVTRTGAGASGSSGAPSISADLGRGYPGGGGNFYDWTYAISYTSAAPDLVFGDTNGVDDVFTTRIIGLSLIDSPDTPTILLDPVPLTTRVSLDAAGGQLTTRSGVSSISANGTRIEYERPLPGAAAPAPLVVVDALEDKTVRGSGEVRYDELSVTGLIPSSGPAGSRVTITGTGLDNPEVSFTLGLPLSPVERTGTTMVASTDPAATGTQPLTSAGPVDVGKVTSARFQFTYTAAPACSYGPAPSEQAFAETAGGRNVTIAAAAGCEWALAVPAGASWMTVSPRQGVGTQNVRIDVVANEDAGPRRARLEITGGAFDVVQAATPCTYTLQAPSSAWDADPHVGAVRITTRSGCAWTAAPAAAYPWVTLRHTQGDGTFDLHYDIAGNGGAARSATFTIAGQTYRIDQAGTSGRVLTLTRIGEGRVTSTPAGIDCGAGGGCTATFPFGQQVTLQASPAAGYTFDGWTGGCTGAGACSVAMNVSQDVVATFRQGALRHTLTIEKTGAGSGRVLSGPGGIDCGATCAAQFDAGTTVSLSAAAEAGSRFVEFQGACATGQVTMNQPQQCLARFERLPAQRPVTVTITGSGRVTSFPAGLDCTVTCTVNFADGMTVSLIATPSAGQRFTWTGACSGTGACVQQISAAGLTVGATFTAGTGGPVALTDVQPRSGPAVGGTVLRLQGSGFSQPGGVSVLVAGVPATAVDVVSDTLIVARTGPLPGAAAVVVTSAATVLQTGDVVVNVAGATASMPGSYRAIALTGSNETDSDGDGLPDAYETSYDLDALVPDGLEDPDADGASNLLEYQQGTHPRGYYRRYLAEGATGPFFDTRISAANAGTVTATALLRFQAGSGLNVVQRIVVPGRERRYTYPRFLPTLAHNSFSTMVESNTEIVVDRSMFWPQAIYGSHAETSVAAPAATWYLAEGATGAAFDLFYLLQNPDLAREAQVQIRFLRPAGAPVVRTYRVPAASRLTIYIDEIPELADGDVSGVVESTNAVPIIVERAMYLTRNGQTFSGGHGSAGVTSPSTAWFLAEGATGSFFDTFILLANPSPTAADLLATFMRPDGQTVTRTYTVPANSRRTVQIDTVDPLLAATSVATSIVSTNGVGVIVERAMYWPGPEITPAFWYEAHNSPGSTGTGTVWAVADGETGPPPVNTATYYLIANMSSFPATVKVSLLFEIGVPPAERTFTIPANSRLTVSAATEFPSSLHRGFGAVIESLGATPAEIVVERAMYSDSEGVMWAAGTNVLATRLR